MYMYMKTIDNYIDHIHVVQVQVILKHIATFIYILEIDLRKQINNNNKGVNKGKNDNIN